jgi:hypothetical protein
VVKASSVAVDQRSFLGQINTGAERNLTTGRADAEIAIRELEALRSVDLVADSIATDQELVQRYRGIESSGDHLRLPQMTSLDGPSLRAAIGRVLSVDTRAVAATTREDAVKEARMLNVLKALEYAVSNIQRKANMGSRY